MIYLLHGADTFTSTARLQALRATLDPAGFNSVTLDSQEATLDALRAACDALAFFGGGRCVEARGLLTRWGVGGKGGKKGAEKTKADGDPLTALTAYLPQLPPTTTLVLWEPGPVEPPPALRRALDALGAAVERFDAPRGRALREWVLARARDLGGAIRPDAAEALLDAACPQGWQEAPRGRETPPPSLQRLDTELRKLLTATIARPDPTLTRRDVAVLVVGEAESNVFDLVNAVAEGDARLALSRLRATLDDGVAPEFILSLLAGQFSSLARLRAAGGARADNDTAQHLGISPYRLPHAKRQLARLGETRVSRCLEIVLAADEAIKTGRSPNSDHALYWAILELCQAGAPLPVSAED